MEARNGHNIFISKKIGTLISTSEGHAYAKANYCRHSNIPLAKCEYTVHFMSDLIYNTFINFL